MEINLLFYVLTFVGGFLSFFSPCVIPLLPIYFSYLAGNGTILYNRKKVFFNTLSFTMGISLAFFILGISFTTMGDFLFKNKLLFSKIGGIIIIVLGLFQLDLFKFKFLQRDYRINYNKKEINIFIAFLTGFTFSFAWTPCIGPALSSILILTSTAENKILGNFLIFLYSLGFIIPFLLIGLFTTTILNFIKNKQKFLKYTVKIGGVILIILGILTFLGYGNVNNNSSKSFNKTSNLLIDPYKGKIIFLNFWATWCPPCREELPAIEELYKEYGSNKKNVIILGVTNPKTEENPYGEDVPIEEIKNFLNKHNLTFPIFYDRTGEYFFKYQIRAYPTTIIIGKDGKIKNIVQGALEKKEMIELINNNL